MNRIILSLLFLSVSFAQNAQRQILLADTDAPVTPTDSPGGGSYGSTQSVTLADATASFILYTTNGTTPSCPATGTLYSGAISVTVTTTIKAIGCNGVTGSGVLSSTYTITGGNNVAIVSGHLGGTGASALDTNSITFAFAGASVTSGNTVLCGISIYASGSNTAFTAAMMTKSAGTSTVGTIALDQSVQAVHDSTAGVALYRIPVTGTGTLTVSWNYGATNAYKVLGCAEFSGINATPLSTTSTATGTSVTQSTGSVITTDVGVMMFVTGDTAGTNVTRTVSDVNVYKIDTGASTFTGCIQYKIINSSPNTVSTTTGADSNAWKVAYALYKTT